VDAWARGKEFCCDSSRFAADLWRDIWKQVELLGGPDGFGLVWVRSHTSLHDVDTGSISAFLHHLNVLADKFAGLGADLSQALVPNDQQVQVYEAALAYYRLLARLCGAWPDDYAQVRDKPIKAIREAPVGWAVHASSPHEPWLRHDGSWVCAGCRRFTSSSNRQQIRAFMRSVCSSAREAGGTGVKATQPLMCFRRELAARGAHRVATFSAPAGRATPVRAPGGGPQGG